MNQIATFGIVLTRVEYGEADRIVTLLTPEYGKLCLMARGVRKLRSRLAGGIELFSVSELVFIQGKGSIGTLISARLVSHYSNIVSDIERVQMGYECIKRLNRATEDKPEADYFDLLQHTLVALNDSTITLSLINAWYQLQLLRLGGHSPNLSTDSHKQKLVLGNNFEFDHESMAFMSNERGNFNSEHIKCFRLLISNNSPKKLSHIKQMNDLIIELTPLIQSIFHNYVRT